MRSSASLKLLNGKFYAKAADVAEQSFCAGAVLVLLAIYLYSVPCSDKYIHGYSLLSTKDTVSEAANEGALSAAISSVQAKVRVRRRLRACCLVSAALVIAGSAVRASQAAAQV